MIFIKLKYGIRDFRKAPGIWRKELPKQFFDRYYDFEEVMWFFTEGPRLDLIHRLLTYDEE